MSEPNPHGIGSPVAFVDPATGEIVHVGYLKEWRSVNGVVTFTTVANREDATAAMNSVFDFAATIDM
ncbi:hypothetical protein [Nocardia africana]